MNQKKNHMARTVKTFKGKGVDTEAQSIPLIHVMYTPSFTILAWYRQFNQKCVGEGW
jgi:hypothetical protein